MPELTTRQQQVLALAAEGYTDKGIAVRLHISHPTVRNTMTSARARLGVHSRTQAVMAAGIRPCVVHDECPLTETERKIALLVAEGLANAEIGRALDCMEGSVSNHLWLIYQKLGIQNRVQLALYTTEEGNNSERTHST